MATLNTIYKMRLIGNSFGSGFQCCFHLRRRSSTTNALAIANEIANSNVFWSNYTKVIYGQTIFTVVQVEQIEPHFPDSGLAAVNKAGQQPDTFTHNASALLVLPRTARLDKSGRGRHYIPTPGQQIWHRGGVLTDLGIQQATTAMQAILDYFNTPGLAASSCEWVVWSRKFSEDNLVTHFSLSPKVAFLHNRKPGVGF